MTEQDKTWKKRPNKHFDCEYFAYKEDLKSSGLLPFDSNTCKYSVILPTGKKIPLAEFYRNTFSGVLRYVSNGVVFEIESRD